MKKLAILVCSTGKNQELADEIERLAVENNFEVTQTNLVNINLPLYSEEAESNGIGQNIKDLTKGLIECDALAFIAPEYNGSVPPCFNNAIAWISRSGEDWREVFNAKPTMIATHSGGGGSHVLMAMRHQLSFLGANVLGRQILTHYKKILNPESIQACLKQL